MRSRTFSEDFKYTGSIPVIETSKSFLPGGADLLNSMNNGENRRRTIETCENIFAQSEQNIRLNTFKPVSNPRRILIYKDQNESSLRSKTV
jgi:hypothetical protein